MLDDLASSATTELELIAVARSAEDRATAEANARRLEAVQSIIDVALNQETLDDTLAAILDRLRRILRTDTATVLLLSEDGAALRVRSSVGLEEEVTGHVVVPIGQGIAGRIAASREPMILTDVASTDAVSEALRREVRSLLGAPLAARRRAARRGARGHEAAAQSSTRRSFGCWSSPSARIAAAIERARLFDAERAARTAAEAASRAKSEFLAIMSHELRTPLNAIGGFTQLLAEGVYGSLEPKQLEALARVHGGQRQLTRVIHDILQFVELERYAPPATLVPVPACTLLAQMNAHLAPRAEAAGIHYRPADCDTRVTVAVPRDAVKDVLDRVGENAVKFTPAGGSVTARCEVDDEEVAIIIADSGPGIPDDRLSSVFEPFAQADASYRRSHEGIGMGLAIARARARQIGGDLAASRAPEGGAELRLTLPRVQPVDTPPPLASLA